MDTPKTESKPSTGEDVSEEATAKEHTATAPPMAASTGAQKRGKKGSVKAKPRRKNNVRKMRMERMFSKAELARRARLSTLTIDRVEKGMPCRMDTKRKILEALGLTPSDRVAVFGEDD